MFVISKGFFVSQESYSHVPLEISQIDSRLQDELVSIMTDQLSGVSRFTHIPFHVRALFFVSSNMFTILTISISVSWFLESLLKSIRVTQRASIHIIDIHTISSASVKALGALFLIIKSCQITKKI